MSDHDRSHPTWEIPPTESGTTAAGADVRARRSASGTPQAGPRPARALAAVAVGLGLVLGGGAAGVAVAAAAGPDGGRSVTFPDAGADHRGPGGDGARAGRGG